MESNSYTLWLFDKKGGRLYPFAAFFLCVLVIFIPIVFSVHVVISVLTISIGMIYAIYGLSKVFGYQVEFELKEDELLVKPLKQARFSSKLTRTTIPYSDINALECYGMEHTKNGFYHLNLVSIPLNFAFKAVGALSVNSVYDTKSFGLKLKEKLDKEGISFNYTGEEKTWQSKSMKVQMWIMSFIFVLLIVFTSFLFITKSIELDSSIYVLMLAIEFFFLGVGFLYYWKKFRKYNS